MLFLTVPQRRLLDMLRQFGTLHIEQAEKILRMEEPDLLFLPTLRALERGGRVQRHGDFLTLQQAQLNTDITELIDVMLLLEPNYIAHLQTGTPPIDLTFFKFREDKLWRYDICRVVPGTEPMVNAALETMNAKYRMLVFLLADPEQRHGLTVSCERCFVWKENGEYTFYK